MAVQWPKATFRLNGSKSVAELRKKSGQIGKDVDKVAAELDSLREKASALQEEIRRVTPPKWS
jgi:uncharacterized coiled-coil DUF342 family protein